MTKEIYEVLVRYNNKQDSDFQRAAHHFGTAIHSTKRHFDPRSYRGVTLHAVLDGVEGALLRKSLRLEAHKYAPIKGPPVFWESVVHASKFKVKFEGYSCSHSE